MKLFVNFDRNKWLYNGLIITFIILYAATAFVSFYHAITFFNIANAIWLSVILSFVAEIGQASVLFSILLTDNKNKFLPWAIMVILTSLQVIGNVVSSFDWIISHNDAGVDGFKRSILFWVQTGDPEMFRVIIAWISGALLPVIALSMTALVAQNIELREKKLKEPVLPEPTAAPQEEPVVDAKDIISEVSKFRPTEEDFEKMDKFLKTKVPIVKPPIEEEPIVKDTERYIKPTEAPVALSKEEVSSMNHVEERPIPTVSPRIPTVSDEFDEPEESDEPDEDFGPIDLTDEIPDQISYGAPFDEPIYNPEISQEVVPALSDEEVHEMNLNEHERVDELDEEVERLSPDVDISHTNGLVDRVIPKIIELPEKVQETPVIPKEEKSHITEEQLEKIRRLAQDNLKKK